MTLKSKVKELARRAGWEITSYHPAQSSQARIHALLHHHGIDAVLDVGANCGGYGQFLRRGGYRGKILSFEPLEEEHRALVKNSKQDPNWLVADRMAIGDRIGEIEINIAGNSESSSILPIAEAHVNAEKCSAYIGTQLTPLSRLDSIDLSPLGAHRASLLKIDTQGFEMPVLQGAEGIMAGIKGIQVELSLTELYAGQALYRETVDWLAARGYEMWNVVPGFADGNTGRLLQMDGLFFR